MRDLLDLTQARIGSNLSVAPRAADAHEPVGAVVEELELTFPGCTIQVVREGDGAGAWDPDRLTQTVQNLRTNAIEYSPLSSSATRHDLDATAKHPRDGGAFSLRRLGRA